MCCLKGNANRDLTIVERFCAGSFAGVFSQTMIYPLEAINYIYFFLYFFFLFFKYFLSYIFRDKKKCY